MKRNFGFPLTGLKRSAVGLGVLVSTISTISAVTALTEQPPYDAIAGRNVFGLKTPPVATNAPPASTPNPAPGIELQGFSTILGRPQVLLKVKIAAKAPDPAKEKALVMEVGQQEGAVEIVAMDAYAGTVSLKNQGELVSLNLKDDGAKPAPGPAIATPPANAAPGARPNLPGVPAPRTTAGAGGAGVTAVDKANSLPARPLRAGSTVSGRGSGSDGNQVDARTLSPEAQRALIEVERERTRDAVEAGRMPPLPPLPPLR